MALGLGLKYLPEDCLLNISSFMLGTPQQLKFKNSKALKQIQRKYNLDIVEFSEDEFESYDEDDDEYIRRLYYGYAIRNKNYTIEEALKIIRRQCKKVKSMIKPYGDTDLHIMFNYYVNGEEANYIRQVIEDIDYSDDDDLLEYMNMRINNIQRALNIYDDDELKFKSVHFQLKKILPTLLTISN